MPVLGQTQWLVRIAAAGLPLSLLLLTGCDSSMNQGREPLTASTEQATAKPDAPAIPADLLSQEMLGQTVSVTGQVVQQCPASGCWLKMKSGGVETFVNLLPSPVRLSENRVGQPVQVTGEVVQRGSDLALDAQQVGFGPTAQDSPEGADE